MDALPENETEQSSENLPKKTWKSHQPSCIYGESLRYCRYFSKDLLLHCSGIRKFISPLMQRNEGGGLILMRQFDRVYALFLKRNLSSTLKLRLNYDSSRFEAALFAAVSLPEFLRFRIIFHEIEV